MTNFRRDFQPRARFHLFAWLLGLALVCQGAAHVRAQLAAGPVIDSFSPKSGAPGDTVIIRGKNFGYLTAVVFTGGASAKGEYDSSKITLMVPAGAKTGPLEVICAERPSVFTDQPFEVTAPSPTPTPTPSLIPVITSATTASGEAGQPFTYQITADRAVTRYAVGNLPAGLSVDQASGLISGTPTNFGTFQMHIDAANTYGVGSMLMTLSISVDTPFVSVTAGPNIVEAASGQRAKLQFTLAYPVPRDTLVAFSISGTAKAGINFALRNVGENNGLYIVIIPAGQTRANVKIVPFIVPSPLFPTGTALVARFKVRLLNRVGYTADYAVGTPSKVAVRLIAP